MRKRYISEAVLPFLYGVLSIGGQTLLLRAVLQGTSMNELSIGLSLFLWLLFSSIGSLTGARKLSGGSLSGVVVILSIALVGGVFSGYLSRAIFSKVSGEVTGPLETLIVCLLTVGPTGYLSGFVFPLLLENTGVEPARVYGKEALGAFAGGLSITVLFMGGVRTEGVLALLVAVAGGFCFLAGGRPISGILSLMVGLVSMVLFPFAQNLRVPEGYGILKRADSPVAEVLVIGAFSQMSLYYGGHLYWSYPSPEEDELPLHVVMPLVSKANPKVLIIGGSPGTIREALRYNDVEVIYMETDPVVMEALKEVLSGKETTIMNNSRVRYMSGSVMEVLKKEGPFDVILLNIPPPSTASTSRFFTKEFFDLLSKGLSEDGLASFKLIQSAGYIPESMLLANASLIGTSKEVFPQVLISSPDYGFAVVSKRPIALAIDTYRQRLPQGLHYFYPELLEDIFFSLRAEDFRRLIQGTNAPVNTRTRPVSYLYNLWLWAERMGSNVAGQVFVRPYLVFIVMVLVVFYLFTKSRRRPLRFVLFGTGFWSMALMVTVLMLFQGYHGVLYEKLGLLSGLFMLGLYLGAGSVERVSVQRTKRMLLLSILLAMMSAFIVFKLEPEWSFYLFCILCGILTALQFALSSKLHREDAHGLYGMELLGSSMAAIGVGLFGIGLFGTGYVVGGVLVVEALVLMVLVK